jgi:hypothetical protein
LQDVGDRSAGRGDPIGVEAGQGAPPNSPTCAPVFVSRPCA